jgi:DNA-binding NarL/FixJ family response regulator
MKKIRVLLADDTLLAREGWKRLLETADDMEVVGEATSAQEALRKVQELSADVLLMDLKWYGDSTAGWSAVKEIRRAAVRVKIICVTAYEELIPEARLAGADVALTKTFGLGELLGLIRELAAREEAFPTPEPPSTLLNSLTPRECQVLRLLAGGRTDKQIAEALTIAQSTARGHVHRVLSKLEVTNRTQAAKAARDLGFIP